MPWKYEVKWWPDDVSRSGQKNTKNIIFVESKPRDLGTFGLVNVDTWINSDETDDAVTPDQPLAIYASVKRGNSPVLNAKVSVIMKVVMRNGTTTAYGPLELFDNGSGGTLKIIRIKSYVLLICVKVWLLIIDSN